MIGEALPMGTSGLGNLTLEKLIEAGKALDRQGLTKAGRGHAKHGGGDTLVFPKPTGNPIQINAQGQRILEKILNHPENEVIFKEYARYGNCIEVFSPDGGVRYSTDGTFIGFLEPNIGKR